MTDYNYRVILQNGFYYVQRKEKHCETWATQRPFPWGFTCAINYNDIEKSFTSGQAARDFLEFIKSKDSYTVVHEE